MFNYWFGILESECFRRYGVYMAEKFGLCYDDYLNYYYAGLTPQSALFKIINDTNKVSLQTHG